MLSTSDPFPGWPSGGERPVIYLRLTFNDLKERYGINNWVKGEDKSLNTPYFGAHFIDDILGPVVFLSYIVPDNIHLDAKTHILIDKDLNVESSIDRLIDVLDLQDRDIVLKTKTNDFVDLRSDKN